MPEVFNLKASSTRKMEIRKGTRMNAGPDYFLVIIQTSGSN